MESSEQDYIARQVYRVFTDFSLRASHSGGEISDSQLEEELTKLKEEKKN